eukprot:scaffold23810_cov131-Isochrysis_galbana.AAC.7
MCWTASAPPCARPAASAEVNVVDSSACHSMKRVLSSGCGRRPFLGSGASHRTHPGVTSARQGEPAGGSPGTCQRRTWSSRPAHRISATVGRTSATVGATARWLAGGHLMSFS